MAEQLEAAYVGGTGITLGAKTFTAAQVAAIDRRIEVLRARRGRRPRMMRMPRHRVAIYGRSYEQMRDLVLQHHVDVLDHGARRRGEHGFRAFAILEPDVVERLRSAGYVVEQFEDVDATGKARQAEVGKGNRYARPTDR